MRNKKTRALSRRQIISRMRLGSTLFPNWPRFFFLGACAFSRLLRLASQRFIVSLNAQASAFKPFSRPTRQRGGRGMAATRGKWGVDPEFAVCRGGGSTLNPQLFIRDPIGFERQHEEKEALPFLPRTRGSRRAGSR